MLPGRLRIAIDIGGVIEDSWPEKCAWLARRGMSFDRVWTRSELLPVLPDGAYRELRREVFAEAAILRHPSVAGSAAGVLTLAERFDVILLSSRSRGRKRITQQWMEQNGLSSVADRITSIGNARSKVDWCRAAGVSVLIDDDPVRFFDDAATDIRQIHFDRGSRVAQGRGPTLHSVPTWGDLLRLVQTHGHA